MTRASHGPITTFVIRHSKFVICPGLMFIQRGEGMEENKEAVTGIINSVAAEK